MLRRVCQCRGECEKSCNGRNDDVGNHQRQAKRSPQSTQRQHARLALTMQSSVNRDPSSAQGLQFLDAPSANISACHRNIADPLITSAPPHTEQMPPLSHAH
jgi:hypothetical protein